MMSSDNMDVPDNSKNRSYATVSNEKQDILKSLKVHHIGYAVKNIDKAINVFSTLGYTVYQKTDDKERNVTIAFAEKSGYCVELISPLSEGSPVDNVLKKSGASPYHICYETVSIKDTLECLEKEKFVVISEVGPAPAIGNSNVVFLYNKVMGLIELVEISD